MQSKFCCLASRSDEGGAPAIEYALIAAFLSLIVVSGAQAAGLDLVNVFGQDVGGRLSTQSSLIR